MIPYIDIPTLHLVGPLSIQPFGVLVAAGVFFGTHMGRKYAERYRLDGEDLRWLGVRVVVWGFIVCHLVDVLLYTPERLKEDPLLLFKVWEGISSYGGIVGGAGAFIYFAKRRGLHPWRWVDAVVYGFVPGMVLGRAACAVAHDHIGFRSDFPLAVDFPADRFPGGPAHDLGLYEMFVWLAIFLVFLGLSRWEGRRPGTLLATWALLYAPPRFFLEFLRRPESDPRYAGLTPAQHLAIVTFAFGLWLVYHLATTPRAPLAEPLDSPHADKHSGDGSRPGPRTRRPSGDKR